LPREVLKVPLKMETAAPPSRLEPLFSRSGSPWQRIWTAAQRNPCRAVHVTRSCRKTPTGHSPFWAVVIRGRVKVEHLVLLGSHLVGSHLVWIQVVLTTLGTRRPPNAARYQSSSRHREQHHALMMMKKVHLGMTVPCRE